MNTQACSEQIGQMVKGQLQHLASDVLNTIQMDAWPIAKQHNMIVDLGIECHITWNIQPILQKRLRSGKNY